MATLDNFSTQSEAYAQYRPVFPQDLIDDLAQLAPGHNLVWDVATGNGQMAALLAPYFRQVIATDLSERQLAQARQAPNIEYRKETAEQSSLLNQSVDMAVVAQAVHWFEFNAFYTEVRRVLKPGGILALLTYGLLETGTGIDELVRRFYTDTLNGYWDPQRRYIDERYETLPFPFAEVTLEKKYAIHKNWAPSELLGYLSTWSAVQHYIDQRNEDPLALLVPELRKAWPEGTDHVEVTFPIYMRLGRL